ncbi:MAG: hypothetical protein AAF688_02430 [Bacteroidota bacterium]
MNSTKKKWSFQGINKFFAILLFGGALFIFSIGSLNANSHKTFDFPENLTKNHISTIQNSNGKYMMQMEVWKNNEGVPQWIILVWDTQTGKSKFYTKNKDKGTIPAHNGWNMPSNPL